MLSGTASQREHGFFLTVLQAGFGAYPVAKAATLFISTIQKASVCLS